jgi:hypothetical protein
MPANLHPSLTIPKPFRSFFTHPRPSPLIPYPSTPIPPFHTPIPPSTTIPAILHHNPSMPIQVLRISCLPHPLLVTSPDISYFPEYHASARCYHRVSGSYIVVTEFPQVFRNLRIYREFSRLFWEVSRKIRNSIYIIRIYTKLIIALSGTSRDFLERGSLTERCQEKISAPYTTVLLDSYSAVSIIQIVARKRSKNWLN